MWNKCSVVMLPTNEKAKSQLILEDKIFKLHPSKIDIGNKNYQHLYITSDEEIKENDWFYDFELKRLSKLIKTCQTPSLWEKIIWRKIIATTDTSLTVVTKLSLKEGNIIHTCDAHDNFPHPSPQFIQHYIEEYNKGNVINEVLVEYDDEPTQDGDWTKYSILKINSDNTINIKPIKDSWGKKEVIELISKMRFDLDKTMVISNESFVNWIEENL